MIMYHWENINYSLIIKDLFFIRFIFIYYIIYINEFIKYFLPCIILLFLLFNNNYTDGFTQDGSVEINWNNNLVVRDPFL